MIEAEETDLYRAYDGRGRLLYVGISLTALGRAIQHRRQSKWFDMAETIKIQRFRTRAEAGQAERIAIRTEAPAFNVVHSCNKRIPPTVKAARRRQSYYATVPDFIPDKSETLGIDLSLFTPGERRQLHAAMDARK